MTDQQPFCTIFVFISISDRSVDDEYIKMDNFLFSDRRRFVKLLRQLKKSFKYNQLLLTASYASEIDDLGLGFVEDAMEALDFMHVSLYSSQWIRKLNKDCLSVARNVSENSDPQYHLYQFSYARHAFGHFNEKFVFEQNFFGFDVNAGNISGRCMPLNVDQICGKLNDKYTEWNISCRGRSQWLEATNQNNSHALVLASKQWLIDQTSMILQGVYSQPGGFMVNLHTDDYSGKCIRSLKEYLLVDWYIEPLPSQPISLPENPTFPLLRIIRSVIDSFVRVGRESLELHARAEEISQHYEELRVLDCIKKREQIMKKNRKADYLYNRICLVRLPKNSDEEC